MNWKPEKEAEVRKLIDRWAQSFAGNPIPEFSKKISIVSLNEKPSFSLQLNSLYDVRMKPILTTRNYSEAAAANLGNKPLPLENIDVWSYSSSLKLEFESRYVDFEIPESFHIAKCVVCEGKGQLTCKTCVGEKTVKCGSCVGGKVSCGKCIGRGRIPCKTCRGKGQVPGYSRDNLPMPDVPCEKCEGRGGDACGICGGTGNLQCGICKGESVVSCGDCKGNGVLKCIQCGATGKIIKGFVLRMEHNDVSQSFMVHDPEMPEGLIPSGFAWSKSCERIVQSQGVSVSIPDLTAHPSYLKPAVDQLLKKAEDGKASQSGTSKIIQQKILVDRIPVYAVVYRFEDKIYDIWLTGADNRIVAKTHPFQDLAQKEAMRAMRLASRGRKEEAQAILKKASSWSDGSLELDDIQQAGEDVSSREFLQVHHLSCMAVGVLLMLSMGAYGEPSRHLFWPVFYFATGAMGAALAAGYLIPKNKVDLVSGSFQKCLMASLTISGVIGLFAQVAFSALQMPRRLDFKEYQSLMKEHFQESIVPEKLSAEDVDFLKFAIKTFEPLGIDVSENKKALEEADRIAFEAKQRAQLEAEAEAKAKGMQEGKAELIRKEIEAAKIRRLQEEAARQAKAKKKKKKTFSRSRR